MPHVTSSRFIFKIMETATNQIDDVSVQPSKSYNTTQSESCNQSVQSTLTHGTVTSQLPPHSPIRIAVTPQSLSPVSAHTNTNNTNQQVVNIDTMGADVIPQYAQQQGVLLGMRQDGWQVSLDQQQQALHNTFQQNRQRSNPASDDEMTEPSSSSNTRENNPAATGYTRSDNNTGATSTFGRLIQSATKVSTCTAKRRGKGG